MTFGWAVHISYAGGKDDAGVFSVNLVMPGATLRAGIPSVPPPAAEADRWRKADAVAAFGDLLFPWKWRVDEDAWRLCGWDEAGVGKDATLTVSRAPEPKNAAAFREHVMAWVAAECKDNEDPFLPGVASQDRGRRSLPHALAPLTHLPAPASGGALHMAGHLHGAVQEKWRYAAFPVAFTVDIPNNASVTFQLQASKLQGQGATATYKGKCTIGGEETSLELVSNLATVTHSATSAGATLSSELLRPGELRQMIADELHPLRILADYTAADLASIGHAKFPQVLVKALGAGAVGAARTSGKVPPPRFPAMLLDRRALDAFAKAASWDPAWLEESEAVAKADDLLKLLGTVTVRYGLDRARSTAPQHPETQGAAVGDVSVHSALNLFFGDPASPANIARLARALIAEQEDGATRLWAAWFHVLNEVLLRPRSATLAEALASRLRPDLPALGGFGRIAWVHRLSAISQLWEEVEKAQGIPAKLGAARAAVADHMRFPGATPMMLAAEARCKDAVAARFGKEAEPRLLRDPGLQIRFEMDEAASDQDLRGYCIAVQPSLDGATWKGAAWVTDTGLRFDATADGWLKDDAGVLRAHDTIGSTYEQGFRSVGAEYDGAWVLAMLEEASIPAQRELLRNAWRGPPRSPVPLAYGGLYRCLAVAIDNAGGELGSPDRLGLTELDKAGANDLPPDGRFAAMPNPPKSTRYLSRVPIGGPTFAGITAEDVALSNDSRLHAWWRKNRPDKRPPPVALVRKDRSTSVVRGRAEIEVAIAPPVTDAAFIRRWFERDAMARDANITTGLSFDALKTLSAEDVRKRADELAGRREGDEAASFHPAAKRIRLQVVFNEETKAAQGNQKILETEVVAGNGALASYGDVVKKLRVSWNATDDQLVGDTIRIKPGSFACVRLSVLAEEDFFAQDGPRQRFESYLGGTDVAGYREFEATEFWIEAIPDDVTAAIGDGVIALEAAGDCVVARLAIDQPSDWIAGLDLERHEWHWSGYDVEFPRSLGGSSDFSAGIATLVNVGSYRESMERVLLSDWAGRSLAWPKGQVLHRHPLPAERGARLVAYTARPILRFRQWLADDIVRNAEGQVAARGLMVPGACHAAPEDRVPPPAWTHSIPLCQTYGANDGRVPEDLARLPNGNLLVFDEAIRRTDDFVRLGGIGEVIDIDLVDARTLANVRHEEKGVNPIFHPLDGAGKEVHAKLELKVSNPFGLTHDHGRNPLVAQTGIVVHPEGAQGLWTLCKVRARRLYLPELMAWGDEKELSKGRIPTRVVKDIRVPLDFCIDIDPGSTVTSLKVAGVAVKLPLAAASDGRRLMVTFHHGMWSGTTLDWRAQVKLQQAKKDSLGWDTVGTMPCYDQDAAFALGLEQTVAKVDATGAYRLRQLLVSDYSEARWLTFIGSFGVNLGAPHDYRLAKRSDDGALQLQRFQGRSWAEEQITVFGPAHKPYFQLAMVYRPAPDVMRGSPDATAGAILGWLQPRKKSGGTDYEPAFVHFGSQADEFVPKPGDRAYLLTFQRINVPRPDRWAPEAGWKEVLAAMFPGDNEEATVRLVPEYLGPIAIA